MCLRTTSERYVTSQQLTDWLCMITSYRKPYSRAQRLPTMKIFTWILCPSLTKASSQLMSTQFNVSILQNTDSSVSWIRNCIWTVYCHVVNPFFKYRWREKWPKVSPWSLGWNEGLQETSSVIQSKKCSHHQEVIHRGQYFNALFYPLSFLSAYKTVLKNQQRFCLESLVMHVNIVL